MNVAEAIGLFASLLAIGGAIVAAWRWMRGRDRPVPVAESRQPLMDFDTAPVLDELIDRESQLAELLGLVRDRGCRVVVLHGLYGIGKSCLAARACEKEKGGRLAFLRRRRPKAIVWRDFASSPHPDDVATSVVAAIGGGLEGEGPTGTGAPGGARRALLSSLNRVPSLIVFDNLESVLSSDGRGEPELEELLVLLAAAGHRSTVVITTRVRPACLAPHIGVHRPVRVLPLDGLLPANARDLVETVATLEGSDTAWEEFLGRLAGHPLVLQLTALHVFEAYDGSIDRYLAANAPRDEGVERLICWHLDRLRPAELDLLFRIAVHFNGVDAERLAEEILDPEASGRVGETLRSLAARLPLERTARGVRLQAFIRDYSTQRLCEAVALELRAGSADLLGRHPLHHPVGDDRAGAAQWRDLVGGVVEELRRDRSEVEVEELLRGAFERLRRVRRGSRPSCRRACVQFQGLRCWASGGLSACFMPDLGSDGPQGPVWNDSGRVRQVVVPWSRNG